MRQRHVHKLAEEGRNSVRVVRRDANDRLKKLLKDHKISEDDEKKALDEIQRVAGTKANLLPPLLEAAKARCTVGEIMNALADVFGRYDGAAKW